MQFSQEFITLALLSGVSLILNIILLIWLARVARHYNSLTKDVDKKTLMSALVGIQKTLAEHERRLVTTKSELTKARDDMRLHVQHVTLKRFNPFGDTGGDQSFILALLDGNKDGVMITSLHSRENTRFYVKSIKGGDGIDHPLSKEEQKLISS